MASIVGIVNNVVQSGIRNSMCWARFALWGTTFRVLAFVTPPAQGVISLRQPLLDHNRSHVYQGFLAIARHASLSFSSSLILSVAISATNEATHTFDANNQLLGSPVIEEGLQEMILGQVSAFAHAVVKLAVTLHHLSILSGV